MVPNHRLAISLAVSCAIHAGLLGILSPAYLYQPPVHSPQGATLEVQLGSSNTNSIKAPPEALPDIQQEISSRADNSPPPTPENAGPALPLSPFSQYIPSRELDVRPQPIEPIIVPFPDGATMDRRRATVTLVLYVSEGGIVEHVETEKSDLPQAFISSATGSFLYAHMQPGMKNNRPVPVKMRIEVEFIEGK